MASSKRRRLSLTAIQIRPQTESALAEFAETVKSAISHGKLAELVVLDRDIFQILPAEMEEARGRLSILGGRVVYEGKPRHPPQR